MPETYAVYTRYLDGSWHLNRTFPRLHQADAHANAWTELQVPAIVIPIDTDGHGVPALRRGPMIALETMRTKKGAQP